MDRVAWAELAGKSGDDLKKATFQALQTISSYIQIANEDDPEVLESVPRLLSLIDERKELEAFKPIVSQLARSVGLWNYITDEAYPSDRILAGAATVSYHRDVTLHREQVLALNILLSGRNLILSAPTSFGKSMIVDILLSTGRYKKVAVVLPTIALLDEFRKRLIIAFGAQFDIIMHLNQEPKTDRPTIFLGTQERLVNREDLGALDLLVVDEFYKLDPSREDQRSITLNAAVYKIIKRTKQFFFLGPNIENLRFENVDRWRFEFLKTRFSTVAVDTFDLRGAKNKAELLSEEAFKLDNAPTLIFVSGPDAAVTVGKKLLESERHPDSQNEEVADWLEANYGSQWVLPKLIRAGIGLHHGRIPRSVASLFVRLFNENDGSLPVLVCSSTLIEGVNTAAKSVIIYDKEINKEDYDFFTFSNIRGRAGRLGQHYIGNVFLFNDPPKADELEVSAPIFDEYEDAPEEFVVHLDESDVTGPLRARLTEMVEELGVPPETLRRFSGQGLEVLRELKAAVEETAEKNAEMLLWSGYPNYRQIQALCSILCRVQRPWSFGAGSAGQLNTRLRRLRSASTMREFFATYAIENEGYEENFEKVFIFLRAAEYKIPELTLAIAAFARHALERRADLIDYEAYASSLSQWFRSPVLKALEENGVPIQIAERFLRSNDTTDSLTARLQREARSKSSSLSKFEKSWIASSLPRPSG